MSDLTAGLRHDLKAFLADYHAFASTNRQRMATYHRLDTGLTVGNLVSLRSAVREANRVAGNAGQDVLFDQGVAIANQLNELIEGVDRNAA